MAFVVITGCFYHQWNYVCEGVAGFVVVAVAAAAVVVVVVKPELLRLVVCIKI